MAKRAPHLSRSVRRSPRSRQPRLDGGRDGFALMMAMITVAILAVLVTEFHDSTGTAFAAANMQRDRLRAEYLARSGVNLTRMLLSQERNIRQLVDGFYQPAFGRPAPQIPVWEFADYMLKPFADFEGSEGSLGDAGYDLGLAEGLGELGGTFEIVGSAENTKLNVNRHLRGNDEAVRQRIAMELFGRFDGYNSPSMYDPLFGQLDEDGRMVTRVDLIANIIDWWDSDTTRAQFDPGVGQVTNGGGEDNDVYQRARPPYDVKNAPYDTYEELHLIQGMTDDIWATFVDPNPNDPRERQFTVYGSGAVNPNGAEPRVILAAICDAAAAEVSLCRDPAEVLKFATMLRMVQQFTMNAPLFTKESDFLEFMEGKGQLYQMLQLYVPPELQFAPVTFSDAEKRKEIADKLVMQASIVTVQATARVGRARKRLRVVVNTHSRWVPPPGTTGKMGPLGVLHYFRFD